MILVEQNLDFIRRLSDRILLIQKGRITGEIPPIACATCAGRGVRRHGAPDLSATRGSKARWQA